MLLCGEWVEEHVLAPVAHRQYVFTVPRLLRPVFARRRAWLGELCQIVVRLLADTYAATLPGGKPGLILFVQTFGDLVNFNRHAVVFAADGSKIRVFEDTALSAQYPEASPCRLSIRTTEGRVVDVCVQYPKGHARNALDRAGIESKFRKMSRSCIDEARATAIIDCIATLDRASDVGDLLKLSVF